MPTGICCIIKIILNIFNVLGVTVLLNTVKLAWIHLRDIGIEFLRVSRNTYGILSLLIDHCVLKGKK